MYADFEALLKLTDPSQQNPEEPYTTGVYQHIPSGMNVVCRLMWSCHSFAQVDFCRDMTIQTFTFCTMWIPAYLVNGLIVGIFIRLYFAP